MNGLQDREERLEFYPCPPHLLSFIPPCSSRVADTHLQHDLYYLHAKLGCGYKLRTTF
jgi:hypothetical protein